MVGDIIMRGPPFLALPLALLTPNLPLTIQEEFAPVH